MKHAVCAVKDKKTGLFDPPFYARHTGEAVREFHIITKKPETKFGKHPEDYDLYHIADYDGDTGNYENFDKKQMLATGI